MAIKKRERERREKARREGEKEAHWKATAIMGRQWPSPDDNNGHTRSHKKRVDRNAQAKISRWFMGSFGSIDGDHWFIPIEPLRPLLITWIIPSSYYILALKIRPIPSTQLNSVGNLYRVVGDGRQMALASVSLSLFSIFLSFFNANLWDSWRFFSLFDLGFE